MRRTDDGIHRRGRQAFSVYDSRCRRNGYASSRGRGDSSRSQESGERGMKPFISREDFQMNENQELADYLKPTEFIDSDNPDIVSKAKNSQTAARMRRKNSATSIISSEISPTTFSTRSATSPRKAPGERRAEQRQGVLHGQGQHCSPPFAGPRAFPRASASSSFIARTSLS